MKKTTIKTTIILIFVMTIVLSNLAMMIVVGKSVKTYFRQQVYDDMNVITRQAAITLKEELKHVEDIIYELSKAKVLVDPAFSWKQKVEFFEKKAEELDFNLFFIVDKNGKCKNLTKSGDEFDVSQNEYFKKAIAGELFTTPVEEDLIDGRNIIKIAAPVYLNGDIDGVFVGIKSVDFISKLCSEFKWQDTGILSVYEKGSTVVGHTNPQVVEDKFTINSKAGEDEYKELVDFFNHDIQAKEFGVGEYFLEERIS